MTTLLNKDCEDWSAQEDTVSWDTITTSQVNQLWYATAITSLYTRKMEWTLFW